VPSGMIGSEGLLELPELSAAIVRGQRVLLVGGKGGRELLRETLTERGAIVLDIEVYQRVPRDIPIAATIQATGASRADILVLTSNETVDQLFRLIQRQQQTALLRCSIAVMSERIAAHARALGFVGAAAVAPQTSDEGLMQAIVQLAGR
jgi:uroporphyrinogen-III synthase